MKTVSTKDELKRAINAKEDCIEVVGELAKEITKKKRVSKGAAWGAGAVFLGGLLAAPITGGASIIVSGAAATAAVSGTTVVLVAIASITGLSLVALKKNYDIEIEMVGQKVRLTRNK